MIHASSFNIILTYYYPLFMPLSQTSNYAVKLQLISMNEWMMLNNKRKNIEKITMSMLSPTLVYLPRDIHIIQRPFLSQHLTLTEFSLSVSSPRPSSIPQNCAKTISCPLFPSCNVYVVQLLPLSLLHSDNLSWSYGTLISLLLFHCEVGSWWC